MLLIPLALEGKRIAYSVEFEGLEDTKALKALELSSQLRILKQRLPSSIGALRSRAEADVPGLLKVLHAHGYYEAKIDIQIQKKGGKTQVIVWITPGPRYRLKDFHINLYCESEKKTHSCCAISLKEIGVTLDKPVSAQTILNGELQLLRRLSECGYPLAVIEDRKVVVDGNTKGVFVTLNIKTGDQALFGTTTIFGTSKVKNQFVLEKITWEEGASYDSRLVESTQNALIDSGLFNSVLITHEDTLSSSGQLPLKIEVSETKYKRVNLGVSYQTVFGPGITFGWSNRNVGKMGRTLSFQGDITRISQTGIASYRHPSFLRVDQEMIAQAQAQHESLFAYSMRSYSVMDRFERKITRELRGSLGFQGERLYVTESVQNGNFWLFELPILVRWSTANHLLNPTRGITVEFTTTPAVNVSNSSEFYTLSSLTESTYHPLDQKERIVLAQKLTFGTIWSPDLSSIPLCKRFLGGSEEELRGYRYKTVSPLREGKPIGGRSAIYWTLEARFRVTQTIGLVPFFDIGNVWTTPWPLFNGTWRKSLGLGVRFFTVFAPFRVDLAFPLDRRKGIDPVYKVLVSIGQMF